MSTDDPDDLVFKALADPRRRRVLDLIRDAPLTTGDICAHFAASLDRCTVMQHIGVLERAELIVSRREGRKRWNHFDSAPIRRIQDRWISGYAAQAVGVLSAIKADVESGGRRLAVKSEPHG